MNKKILITVFTLLSCLLTFSQRPDVKKITISGKVIEKGTNQPLEYATIVFENNITKQLSGGITDENGNFKFEVTSGKYNVRAEFISFKSIKLAQTEFNSDVNLGVIAMEPDVAQLNEIEVVAEKSTVEIKLDKRVYNVGKDMIVKGGTVSDVLDNVPSITVDAEGTVALRGNENVKILIDGKPSGLAGINIADALKLLPADAVEKVEVITNPSARYDAEGGGGIINIVLRKGKANGVNGSVMVNAGDPETYGTSINLNKKSNNYNLFSNIGYNYRNNPGNTMVDAEYFNADGSTNRFIKERRTNERLSKGYNANFGIDLNLSKSLSWTNAITFRENNGENPDNVFFYNFDATNNPTFVRNRLNDQKSDEFSIEYTSNFTKKFKKDDHKLTIDFATSQNRENEYATIYDQILENPTSLVTQGTTNKNNQQRNLIQSDYVLPIGKNGRFEAGYRGSFQKNLTDFVVTPVSEFSNTLEYIENVNALYTQYGSKINKFSYFFGLRFEDSHIEVNSLSLNDYKGWCYGLKKAGYATDPRYPERLIELIERYKLQDLNASAIENTPIQSLPANNPIKSDLALREVYRFNHIRFVIAKENDSFYKIAHDFNIELEDILEYNDLSKTDKLYYGQKIYIEKKRRRALEPYHVVQKNETLKSISQLHGIRLSSLCKKNRLKPDDKLKIGDILYLRHKKNLPK